MTASSAPQILTFGCRLNVYESESMREMAAEAGMENSIIVNTCAVTVEAERQARQAIRKAKKENPHAKIIVTGCAAQVNPDQFAAMPEVDLVIDNDQKMKPQSWQRLTRDLALLPLRAEEKNEAAHAKIQVNDIMAVRETAHHLVKGFEDHSRAFIQVQNGCDHRCTFCIIPFGRGPSRSVPIGEIVKQMKLLVAAGYKEIVVSGVDVTSYGHDLPGKPRLGQMLRRALALVPELPRLRLSSLDPVEIDEDLWHLIAEEPRLMPHLHLSLQAGDDMILKRMKRRHLAADLISFCEKARRLRPGIVFGADIIAGFPTEDEVMFQNGYQLIDDLDILYFHVFPYSPRPGTPAAKMPQNPGPVRKARAQKLRELGAKKLAEFLPQQIGKTFSALCEKNNMARSEEFLPIKILGDKECAAGSLVNVKITGSDAQSGESHLHGVLV